MREMTTLPDFDFYLAYRQKKNNKLLHAVLHNDTHVLETYKNIFHKKPLSLLTSLSSKSLRKHYEEYISSPSFGRKTVHSLQQFLQGVYRPFIEKILKQYEDNIKQFYVCNQYGQCVLFFVIFFYPQFLSFFGILDRIRYSYLSFLRQKTSYRYVRLLNLSLTDYFLVTEQYGTFSKLTPSSRALCQTGWTHSLTAQQVHILKRLHLQSHCDKTDYNGSYGVYFQLLYTSLDRLDVRIRQEKENTLYVFHAPTLLNKIVSDMNNKKIQHIERFIYFNPGWRFGKHQSTTIFYSQRFLDMCRPYLERRNECVIRWIIPVDITYGFIQMI